MSESDSDSFGPKPLPERHCPSRPFEFAALYEVSFPHSTAVTGVAVSGTCHFIMSGSSDGVVKFWRKQSQGIEFVKSLSTRLDGIAAMAVSEDGRLLAILDEETVGLCDVENFTMFSRFSIRAKTAAFLESGTLALSTRDSRVLVVDYEGRIQREEKRSEAVMWMHSFHNGTLVTVDEGGNIEVSGSERLAWTKKVNTDLYELRKKKVKPRLVRGKGEWLVVLGKDERVRVWDIKTGKMMGDWSLREEVTDIGIEEKGDFIFLTKSKEGIDIRRAKDGEVVRKIGELEESERFQCIALYEDANKDNLLLTTYRDRMYVFSKRLPEKNVVRDVY